MCMHLGADFWVLIVSAIRQKLRELFSCSFRIIFDYTNIVCFVPQRIKRAILCEYKVTGSGKKESINTLTEKEKKAIKGEKCSC